MNCPCCGSPVTALSPAEQAARELPPVQAALLRALARDFGQFVPGQCLADRVWGNTPTGLPVTPKTNVSDAIGRMRPALRQRGMDVETRHRVGYRLVRFTGWAA